MEARDVMPAVEIDRRKDHQEIVFFQDRDSRFTVAVDRETGEVLGESARKVATPAAVNRVMVEVRRYRLGVR